MEGPWVKGRDAGGPDVHMVSDASWGLGSLSLVVPETGAVTTSNMEHGRGTDVFVSVCTR